MVAVVHASFMIVYTLLTSAIVLVAHMDLEVKHDKNHILHMYYSGTSQRTL